MCSACAHRCPGLCVIRNITEQESPENQSISKDLPAAIYAINYLRKQESAG